mmetsp:Transcript_93547/g.260482  ORF Transcript_93547/g.260482 Transcript_93547/m.260482 type:complete len:307 (-) Transcript_93547:206-1126(-)
MLLGTDTARGQGPLSPDFDVHDGGWSFEQLCPAIVCHGHVRTEHLLGILYGGPRSLLEALPSGAKAFMDVAKEPHLWPPLERSDGVPEAHRAHVQAVQGAVVHSVGRHVRQQDVGALRQLHLPGHLAPLHPRYNRDAESAPQHVQHCRPPAKEERATNGQNRVVISAPQHCAAPNVHIVVATDHDWGLASKALFGHRSEPSIKALQAGHADRMASIPAEVPAMHKDVSFGHLLGPEHGLEPVGVTQRHHPHRVRRSASLRAGGCRNSPSSFVALLASACRLVLISMPSPRCGQQGPWPTPRNSQRG